MFAAFGGTHKVGLVYGWVFMVNEQEMSATRQRVALVAQAMLSGELAFLEGVFELAELSHDPALARHDAGLRLFVVMASELDGLPIGPARQYWSKAALLRHQPSIEAATVWARGLSTEALRNLVARFGGNGVRGLDDG
ncbi:DUF2489 domain-containing protein [Methylovulum psychrotolerans]|uniref:DUF2489 domain-containing protein n=2 Tax=Methylovulum psychrotolerans TaxID=1704499 RepID=A0A1Z4C1X6_9GAMM|nr:DUF2489 domain-containing protein [Methylovulum psychrotolerans]